MSGLDAEWHGGLPDRGRFVDRLLEVLRVGTGHEAGDHDAPPGYDRDPVFPFSVVDLLPGGEQVPTAAHPDQGLVVPVQVTAVGESPGQALWLADRAASTILGRVTPTGGAAPGWIHDLDVVGAYSVTRRERTLQGAARPEGKAWNVAEVYAFELWRVGPT